MNDDILVPNDDKNHNLITINIQALEAKGYEFVEAEVSMIPATMTKLTDAKQIELMDKLIDNLEDMDDVQNVYHNWEQDEEEDEE